MNQRPYKQKVSISLDEDVIEIVKGLAEEDDRTFSSYVNMILRRHIKTLQANSSENGQGKKWWKAFLYRLYYQSAKTLFMIFSNKYGIIIAKIWLDIKKYDNILLSVFGLICL